MYLMQAVRPEDDLGEEATAHVLAVINKASDWRARVGATINQAVYIAVRHRSRFGPLSTRQGVGGLGYNFLFGWGGMGRGGAGREKSFGVAA